MSPISVEDYYKIFPHLKPAEEVKNETPGEPKEEPKKDPDEQKEKTPEDKKEASNKALNAIPEIPPHKSQPKQDLDAPIKKKNFFAMLDEEDEVIMKIKEQKIKTNKIKVNIRENADKEKDTKRPGLDRLKEFKIANDEEDRIIKNAIEVSNAISNDPALNKLPEKSPSENKLAAEAPAQLPTPKKSSFEAPASYMKKESEEDNSSKLKNKRRKLRDMQIKSNCEEKGQFSSRFDDNKDTITNPNQKYDNSISTAQQHKSQKPSYSTEPGHNTKIGLNSEMKKVSEKAEELEQTKPKVSGLRKEEDIFAQIRNDPDLKKVGGSKRRASDGIGSVEEKRESEGGNKGFKEDFRILSMRAETPSMNKPEIEKGKLSKVSSENPNLNLLAKIPSFKPQIGENKLGMRDKPLTQQINSPVEPIKEVVKENLKEPEEEVKAKPQAQPDPDPKIESEIKEKPREERKGKIFFKPRNSKKDNKEKQSNTKDNNRKDKKIGQKPIHLMNPGRKPNLNLHGIDSDDENDYPFDDGFK
eukprot:CAMPEP_0197000206 /NCGR_PEP_ID=MMETSP1380-20130617/5198_1 /TAXON_ID=5936 /ORGANISM="Euplotes crassus, Strain CT5" /LENGTH=527 /DNA_ID=CAMNT_0042417403 /DNA_START=329 /DNA_END=1911 /DNA_ORIENTATION=+